MTYGLYGVVRTVRIRTGFRVRTVRSVYRHRTVRTNPTAFPRLTDRLQNRTSLDLQAVAAAQGLKDRRRRGEAVEGLTKAGFLVAAVGGFRIEP